MRDCIMTGITTMEQSARLLAAGLDATTADAFSGKDGLYIAWSMGRLWQILHENGIFFYEYATNDPVDKVMESLVFAVERAAKSGSIKQNEYEKDNVH